MKKHATFWVVLSLLLVSGIAAKQTVDIGSSPNDGTGDTLRSAFDKLNDNFLEVPFTVDTVADLVALVPSANYANVYVRGYYSIGDGGGGMFTPTNSVTSTNLGTRIVSTTSGWSWERIVDDGVYNVKHFGAKGDDSTDDTVAIQAAINNSPTGAEIYFPDGDYLLSTADTNSGCLYISRSNIRLRGSGPGAVLKTSANDDTILFIASTNNYAASSFTTVSNVVVSGLKFQGTGTYEYHAAFNGIGIVGRALYNSSIENCTFEDMSMIGVQIVSGGNNAIVDNIAHNCKFTGFNVNGYSYSTTIEGNVVSGDGNAGTTDCPAIQANGNVTITGNRIYGHTGGGNKGVGIAWGEGPWSGVASISDNIIGGCYTGIYLIYNGPATVTGNTIYNCNGLGGIYVIDTVTGSFPVAARRMTITGNQVINCDSRGITLASDYITCTGNSVMFLEASDEAASASGSIAQVTIDTSIHTDEGILIAGNYNNVVGNTIYKCIRAIVEDINYVGNQIGWNQMTSHGSYSTLLYSLRNTPAATFVNYNFPVQSVRTDSSGNVRRTAYKTSTPPSSGRWSEGDECFLAESTYGSNRYTVTERIDTTLGATVSSGTNIVVASTSGIRPQDFIEIARDDLFVTSSQVYSIDSGTDLSLTTAVGGTSTSGNAVRITRWERDQGFTPSYAEIYTGGSNAEVTTDATPGNWVLLTQFAGTGPTQGATGSHADDYVAASVPGVYRATFTATIGGTTTTNRTYYFRGFTNHTSVANMRASTHVSNFNPESVSMTALLRLARTNILDVRVYDNVGSAVCNMVDGNLSLELVRPD